MIAANDPECSECGCWVKRMSPMWINESQGYVFFEEAPASRFVFDDVSNCDSELSQGSPEIQTGERWGVGGTGSCNCGFELSHGSSELGTGVG